MSEPLVVIGNGMAAARLVEELAKESLGRYAVAVIGDEPRLAYNRVLLSSVLAGDVASHEIELKSAAWWRDRGVTVTYGCAAASIDLANRRVRLADGAQVEFSKLVLATGSNALRLNVPGAGLPGVHTFRDSRDVGELLSLATEKRHVVVVGGGLLGLEAAHGLVRVHDVELDAGSLRAPRVAHLTAALAIERRAVDHDLHHRSLTLRGRP